ncbi:hypothetical protein BESB_054710 [Besnoitia besnoiti]|uniref:Uncharacterized protein n=1 Tax=Besnoitia besnoiti TaxID=94643 RepID=A0A2A9MK71_BESBE|nr:hypothetical protein BESB_054710 [Besnoitia besnoiti]PFH35820.1 hypothetical protein BESB_054710 [Besnoitia besnoiti]
MKSTFVVVSLFALLAFEEVAAVSQNSLVRDISLHNGSDTVETSMAEVGKKKLWEAVKDVMKSLFMKLGLVDQCAEKKKKNQIPSAAAGDAPIPTFGYPAFDVTSGAAILRGQAPLSFLEGHMQPVKVGAKDWLVQGTADDILRLFFCFERYHVIAEKLQADGTWKTEGDVGPLYVQIQSTAKYGGSPLEILAAYSIEKLKAQIETWGPLDNALGRWWEEGANAVKNGYDILGTYNSLKERIPSLTKDFFGKTWNDVAKAKGPKEKMKALATFFTLNDETRALREEWENLDGVDRDRKMTVYLTSYPSHSPTMATFAFKSNVATMGDVAAVLLAAVRDPTVDNVVRGLGFARRKLKKMLKKEKEEKNESA